MRTIFFEMQLIELIFVREIQIIVCNKLRLFFLAFLFSMVSTNAYLITKAPTVHRIREHLEHSQRSTNDANPTVFECLGDGCFVELQQGAHGHNTKLHVMHTREATRFAEGLEPFVKEHAREASAATFDDMERHRWVVKNAVDKYIEGGETKGASFWRLLKVLECISNNAG